MRCTASSTEIRVITKLATGQDVSHPCTYTKHSTHVVLGMDHEQEIFLSMYLVNLILIYMFVTMLLNIYLHFASKYIFTFLNTHIRG